VLALSLKGRSGNTVVSYMLWVVKQYIFLLLCYAFIARVQYEFSVKYSWASAHRGKWGQLTFVEKWMKTKKRKMQYRAVFLNFMLYFESNQGRQV